MIEVSEILQTIRMVSEQHFDIRTITMGISLLDCKKNTDRETAQAVYDKVTRVARDLVRVGGELESELGVPLFVRNRGGVTLTADGRALLGAAGAEATVDGSHLTDLGFYVLAQNLAPLLEKMLG